MTDEGALEEHCRTVLSRMEWTAVVPFLGAGANLCERPDLSWENGDCLPSGVELAEFLAERHRFPEPDRRNLARVSQFVELFRGGETALYEQLRRLFTGSYQPNKLHRLLAELPGIRRERGADPPFKLIVTTNYDDALESAFDVAGEAYELVYYAVRRRDHPGGLVRVLPDGRRVPAARKVPVASADPPPMVILKIHGAVDRTDAARDSYVITEDDYIDYLALTDVSKLIPASLMATMRTSNFLFLGYGMRDWNLRVILHRIWAEQELSAHSWAIQKDPDEIDVKFWTRHAVDIVDVALEDWVDWMRRILAE
jgi:hypothetical protein